MRGFAATAALNNFWDDAFSALICMFIGVDVTFGTMLMTMVPSPGFEDPGVLAGALVPRGHQDLALLPNSCTTGSVVCLLLVLPARPCSDSAEGNPGDDFDLSASEESWFVEKSWAC
jgi:hypothetical protein